MNNCRMVALHDVKSAAESIAVFQKPIAVATDGWNPEI